VVACRGRSITYENGDECWGGKHCKHTQCFPPMAVCTGEKSGKGIEERERSNRLSNFQ